ncbi:hypothetical protein KIN20_028537 [Parelaphostrongylus tenuis]|uniref:Uncharacterized protein n=1 Tax=Parelaphostrongylus tenuis TaxID=148309 RepID=A0AAD5WEV9_PARTN|nr:hypothetical protein KIN20_028537 [Parelaphostrongylus tenuis]
MCWGPCNQWRRTVQVLQNRAERTTKQMMCDSTHCQEQIELSRTRDGRIVTKTMVGFAAVILCTARDAISSKILKNFLTISAFFRQCGATNLNAEHDIANTVGERDATPRCM